MTDNYSVTAKTDPNYGKGVAVVAEDDSLDPVLKAIRLQIKEVVSKENFEIPLLPTVATQILQMANNPKVGISDIEKLVKQDQVIAAKIIKTANSSFYRGLQTIVSLREAMGRIGLKALKDIVFSLSLHGKIFQMKGFEKTLNDVWNHSVACAAISQMIAKKLGIDSEYAFLAGLVHDIGKPVLIQVIAQLEESERKKAAAAAKAQFKTFDAKSFKIKDLHEVLIPVVFQEYHAAVGSLVAARWKLPDLISEVIRYHHDYSRAKDAQTMTTVVSLANQLCHHFGYGHESTPLVLHHQKAFFDLNLSQDQIHILETAIPPAVDSLVDAMGHGAA